MLPCYLITNLLSLITCQFDLGSVEYQSFSFILCVIKMYIFSMVENDRKRGKDEEKCFVDLGWFSLPISDKI